MKNIEPYKNKIKQKFDISEYETPKFIESFFNVLTLGEPKFINIDDVSRLKNWVRKKKSDSPEYQDVVLQFAKDFYRDGGWNPKFPLGLYCNSYNSRGKKQREFLGFTTKAYTSHKLGCPAPFREVIFDDELSEEEISALKQKIKQTENRIIDRTTENPITQGDIEVSLEGCKDKFETLKKQYEEDNKNDVEIEKLLQKIGYKPTLEENLHDILKDYGKDHKLKKWVDLVQKLIGAKNSSFVTMICSDSDVTEWFRTEYSGDSKWKGLTILNDIEFADISKTKPQKVFEKDNEKYKPIYLTLDCDRDIMKLAKKINSEIDNGDCINYVLFGGLYKSGSSSILEKDVDTKRKTMLKNIEKCLEVFKPKILERIKFVGFVGQKNSEMGKIIIL